ncbi:MAG: (d)CMP kinase [Planctomycetes bacterium]|nr:(d)CMP kinase [Planctomycetota bacterium]MCP4771607.1 (d)CMP kinase [Planctomycetota bacterium]MCP4860093.1 (d)CMP kinase [Planctomycetota bacterium]
MGTEPQFQSLPVVTLDGHSGSGKSTLAQRLAERLGWSYLDSGAWYRALTWAVLEVKGDTRDSQVVLNTLSSIRIESNPKGQVLVNGQLLGNELRTAIIDHHVSNVADHVIVREALNQRMRQMLEEPGVQGLVADGRDAGTVIFPDAGLMVFVEVPLEVRAQRRFEQNQRKGIDSNLSDVTAALANRDARDAARGDAAPQITKRSRLLDNSNQTVEEAIGCLLEWTAKNRLVR